MFFNQMKNVSFIEGAVIEISDSEEEEVVVLHPDTPDRRPG